MSNIMREAEQEIQEQAIIEKKLSKARKVDKSIVEKKKGQKVNWKPANRLPKIDAPEGFVPAWKHNTPENIRRLQYEGWQVASRIEHKMDVEMGDYYKKLNDKSVSENESTITHNELIAMVLPEDLAEARRDFYRQETERQTRAKLKPDDNRLGSAIRQGANITTTMEIN